MLVVQLFVSANLDAKHNHWRRVFDFNKGELTTPEPHWVIMGGSQLSTGCNYRCLCDRPIGGAGADW